MPPGLPQMRQDMLHYNNLAASTGSASARTICMNPLIPLLAGVMVAAAAWVSRLVVWLSPRRLIAWLPWLHASAAGLLLGDALLHMLPDALARGLGQDHLGLYMALGMLALLLIECLLRQLGSDSSTATFARMDLIGDLLHHGIDGIVIGAAFAAGLGPGMIMALAIAAHELPREMGHAGVLVAGGYPPRQAIALSLATSIAVPVGAVGIALSGQHPGFLAASLALAAGATLYLACGDLLPGLWPALNQRRRFTPVLGVAGGMATMWLATLLH